MNNEAKDPDKTQAKELPVIPFIDLREVLGTMGGQEHLDQVAKPFTNVQTPSAKVMNSTSSELVTVKGIGWIFPFLLGALVGAGVFYVVVWLLALI